MLNRTIKTNAEASKPNSAIREMCKIKLGLARMSARFTGRCTSFKAYRFAWLPRLARKVLARGVFQRGLQRSMDIIVFTALQYAPVRSVPFGFGGEYGYAIPVPRQPEECHAVPRGRHH